MNVMNLSNKVKALPDPMLNHLRNVTKSWEATENCYFMGNETDKNGDYVYFYIPTLAFEEEWKSREKE